MPPRIRLRSLKQLADLHLERSKFICNRCQYATAAAVTTAPTSAQMKAPPPSMSIAGYPPTQPPSHRNPTYRKSQLLRSYVSLLETSPLILVFQYNNLKSSEWVGIRRELASALKKVDVQLQQQDTATTPVAHTIKLQVIQTNIFEPALRIAEYFDPSSLSESQRQPALTHVLSSNAYEAVRGKKHQHPLTALLTGPIALLPFPTVSPAHVRAALSILSPKQPNFAAPTRRTTPTYWDPPVQDGLKKLMLLGARVEGRVLDIEGTRWVGGLQSVDALRAQLVGLLQGFGAGLVHSLESAGRSLWFTVEGRRNMLEEEQKPKESEAEQEKKSDA